MKDEVVIIDTNFAQMTGARRTNNNDISIEIMDRYGIAQRMVDVYSCEAMISRTLQEPHDGKLCVPHHMVGRQRLLSP